MTYDLQAEGINGVTAPTSVTANSGFDTGPVWFVDGTQGGTGAIFGTSFSDGVRGQTSGGAGNGVHGVSTLSGNGFGVLGDAGFGGPNVSVGIGVVGRAGVGVYGMDSPSTSLPFPVVGDGGVVGDGQTIGVRGRSGPGTGVFGTGVIGVKGGVSLQPTKALDGTMPSNVGVWGTSIIPLNLFDSGDWVLGEGLNGVHGRSQSPTDSGVWGENIKGGFGVSGTTNGGTGTRGPVAGVWGSNFGAGAGVRGTSTGGTGVLGEGPTGVSGVSTNGNGVHGKSASNSDSGVWGENTSTRGTGVAGNSVGGFGVSGQSQNGTGVSGVSTNGTGVSGTSASRRSGLGLQSPAIFGEHTAGGAGVWGLSSGPGSVGVLGSGDYGGDLWGATRRYASVRPGLPDIQQAENMLWVSSMWIAPVCSSTVYLLEPQAIGK